MKSFKKYCTESTKVKGVYRDDNFRASVDAIVKLSENLPIQERDVKQLIKTNHDVQTKEGMFEDMIENPNNKFMERVNQADMKYPILINSDDYIIDGAHRLAKAYFNKQDKIKTKVVSDEIIKKASKQE